MASTPKLRITGLALCCGVMAGCATTGGNQQLMGAGIGTAAGCLFGTLIAGETGCAVGAALGAAAGWGVVAQYQATQVRSAAQDQQLYGLTEPVSSTQVQIRKGTAAPNTVRPGDTVKVATDYSLMMPTSVAAQGADVEESWVLKKDGKVLANLPPQKNHRTGGGWAANASIPIPKNAQAGTYVVEHKVQAGSSYDTDESVFIVGS